MIRINEQYLNRFKCTKCEYLFYMAPGLFLAFDKESLEYIGIEEFYLADMKKLEGLKDKTLNKLIANNILEVI